MNVSSSIIYILSCRNIEREILLGPLLQSIIQGKFDLEIGLLREKNIHSG